MGGTVGRVTSTRRCSRTACGRPAVATLTYVYADQTAVLGPLALYAEPHAYDLCEQHSERLSAPRGWEVLRLAPDPSTVGPSSDDLLALDEALAALEVKDKRKADLVRLRYFAGLTNAQAAEAPGAAFPGALFDQAVVPMSAIRQSGMLAGEVNYVGIGGGTGFSNIF